MKHIQSSRKVKPSTRARVPYFYYVSKLLRHRCHRFAASSSIRCFINYASTCPWLRYQIRRRCAPGRLNLSWHDDAAYLFQPSCSPACSTTYLLHSSSVSHCLLGIFFKRTNLPTSTGTFASSRSALASRITNETARPLLNALGAWEVKMHYRPFLKSGVKRAGAHPPQTLRSNKCSIIGS